MPSPSIIWSSETGICACRSFALLEEWEELKARGATQATAGLAQRRFCNFIYANPNAHPARDAFFHGLNAIEPVESLGPHLRNTQAPIGTRYSPSWRRDKLEVQSNYKFSIAFENAASPGYTTEKIMHALASDTIPIYWGDPCVSRVFNAERFIDAGVLGIDKAIDRVLELHRSDEAYLDMLGKPFFSADADLDRLSSASAKAYVRGILTLPEADRPRRNRWMWGKMYEDQRRKERDAFLTQSRASLAGRLAGHARKGVAGLVRKARGR